MIRVDGWQVCQSCVSNNVLERAIEVRTKVKKLTAAISSAHITHQQDSKRLSEAKERLQAAYADVEAAIKNLAVIGEDSQKSLTESLVAAEALKEYREGESEKTSKARK